MRRSDKPRSVGIKSVLLALAIMVGLVFALFRLVAPDRIAGTWPWGIGRAEVDRYARWTDIHWERTEAPTVALWTLGGSARSGPCAQEEHGRQWHRRWFVTGDHADTVRMRRHPEVDGGFIIRFRREAPFNGQRRLELLPAHAGSIRAKYLEILADELGLPVAEVTFVRVASCGDTTTYLAREWMGRVLLEKRMITDAVTYRQAHHPWMPAELFPKLKSDSLVRASLRARWTALHHAGDTGIVTASAALVETDLALSWLLMRWLEGSPDPLRERGHLAWRWEHARIMPLYVPAAGEPAAADDIVRPWAVNPFSALLRDDTYRKAFLAKRDMLIEHRWRIRERFAAADEAWLPVIADGLPLPIVRSRAQRIQASILDQRLDQGDPLAHLDRKLVPGAGMATFLGAAVQGAEVATDNNEALFARLRRMRVQVAGDSIVFPRGKFVLDEDLFLPAGYDVVLLRGARFELGPGVNVLVRGGLKVQGTKLNPVFIRPQRNDEPFGSFAVTGAGKSEVSISGLRISGGSEGFLAGMYHSGMLSIRGVARTLVSGSVISGSKGEDALNIKGGEVLVQDCEFNDGHADLLDIDMATGVVRNSVFRSPSGTALDISGTQLLVEDCRFIGMRDEGISVGESSSALVRGSRFERNTTAIAVKDLSVAHVLDNVFQGNVTALEMYRKKPILGGGSLHLYPNTFSDNEREREVDEHSEILPGSAPPAELLRTFEQLGPAR
jgi:hypothetical protein